MCQCPKCSKPLFTLIDYTIHTDKEEYNQLFKDGNINRELMVAKSGAKIRNRFCEWNQSSGLSSGANAQEKWCESCNKVFIFCCGQRPIIQSLSSLGKDEWYTFEDGKFVKHPLDDWPYDGPDDEDSYLEIESLQIVDENDPQLDGLYLTGPDGGGWCSFECLVCGNEISCTDK